jgi:hypothetical protein
VTRSHAKQEPAANHIRRAKPGKPVQTATLLPGWLGAMFR